MLINSIAQTPSTHAHPSLCLSAIQETEVQRVGVHSDWKG